ncbi:hypothetical protein HYALB_00002640 [Hymenoscyphus albidus]|uniref:Dicer-like protein 1 n=1 Tax=Hymenoscyphus albidus TaxID=595503 RepID=A0A9N9LWN0_9HELO|nr:hypothetical protein HYALB_00002640 [Hymenoscyphus albidus]
MMLLDHNHTEALCKTTYTHTAPLLDLSSDSDHKYDHLQPSIQLEVQLQPARDHQSAKASSIQTASNSPLIIDSHSLQAELISHASPAPSPPLKSSLLSSATPLPLTIENLTRNQHTFSLSPSSENTRLLTTSMDPAIATALPQRTGDDVITDLQRARRPANIARVQNWQGSSSTIFPEETLPDPSKPLPLVETKVSSAPQIEERDGYATQSDDDNEVQAAAQARAITERKRRQNSIANNYLQEKLRNPTNKQDHQVKPGEEAVQSTRWIVDHTESAPIISTPREYQNELYERAKEKNIIAVLDTGSGKTLIAVLLLRHILAQELEDRADGKVKRTSFFLVDSVTLVFQQHRVLKNNLNGMPMDMFCGNMGTKLWDREKWTKILNDNMVIVCTAEVLRHCLGHGFVSMNGINLLVFDEAHHAKKDHPYARIIMDHYAVMPQNARRPKIFGMTASPVDAKVSPRKAAEELEVLLHCEIATAHDTSLLQYTANKTEECLCRYESLPATFCTPLYTQMSACLTNDSVLRKPLLFAHEASRHLGAWCSDQLWRFCLEEEEVKKLVAKTESKHRNENSDRRDDLLEQKKTKLSEAQAILKAHAFDSPDYRNDSNESKNLSSKVVELIKILREEYKTPTESKCIVFVQQRYTALLLARLFQESGVKTDHLRVGTLVGARSGEAGDQNNSFRQQVLTMMNFRRGKVNCLFATSVAEEGLDIPDCNLIVRFDLYSTVIQYIQSRGRARHANSRYIHMAEQGNREHEQTIRDVRLNEGILRRFCNEVPEDRQLTGNNVDMDYFLRKEKSQRIYMVPTTGAKLTYKMSLGVLANFVSNLEAAPDTNLHPEYIVTVQNKRFIGEVILPEGSPVRGAVGRPASTKQVAKCSAAFEACCLLIQKKYLDDHLLPTYAKRLPAMRNALLAVDSKKRDTYDMKTKPSLWSAGGVPQELFMTILSLKSPQELDRASQSLALLTRSRIPSLPSFTLHFGDGKHSGVNCVSSPTSLQVSTDMLRQINTFTLAIFDDVFSKTYESDPSKMPYFLAPLKESADANHHTDPAASVDWEMLTEIDEHQQAWQGKNWELKSWQTEPDEFFAGKYIVDPYDGSRKLWCKGVAPQYRPLDPVPPNCAARKGTRQRTDNIMEYSSSLWEKARARRTFDENQRVFEAELIPLRRNLLDEFDRNVSEGPKRCFVILEILKISALPSTVVSMAYIFPAIIHRIEAYLIAFEACELLHLDIRADLALEAVTKDSDNSGDHGEEKIDFQRGMGNNYERLEFLGDCFLKMATSITLYGTKPDSDEYSYHVDRMVMICNKNLKNVAIKLKLYEYIRSQAFNRRAWYPEGLTLKKGKTATAPNQHKLGDKTIADVSEALIGAALLTHHSENNMDYAVRAVTELVCSENHNVTSWADYYNLYKKPTFQTQRSTQMQLEIAKKVEMVHSYHFQSPRLLRSAFIHPSYPYSYERIPSYQRLEFLGDSLLDMVCVNYLFHAYPGKDPQWLTEHKMAMVSNAFLGCLCVELGFNAFLLIFNQIYQKQIGEYVDEIKEAKLQAQDEAERAGKSREDYAPDYWTAVRPPPKCLPDIVEAYIGAIFVDSEYDYSRVEDFFQAHIKWYFKDMSIYDTYANKQPTTFLSNFFAVSMCCENWTIQSREIPSIDGSKAKVLAMIIVHDQVVADWTAESGRYAKVSAAKKALELLKGLSPRRFRQKYGCTCAMPEEEDGVVNADADPTAI